MKLLIALFVFLATAGVALSVEVSKTIGETHVTLTPTIVAPGAPAAPAEAMLLPECTDVTVHDASPETVVALLPAILLGLRLLAEGLGALAAKGSTSAGAAARVVTYILSMLGWAIGKMGWGAPKQAIVKTLPKFKSKEKPAA